MHKLTSRALWAFETTCRSFTLGSSLGTMMYASKSPSPPLLTPIRWHKGLEKHSLQNSHTAIGGYGLTTVARLDWIAVLFCKRSLFQYVSFTDANPSLPSMLGRKNFMFQRILCAARVEHVECRNFFRKYVYIDVYVYVCIYVYIYVCMYLYIHVHIHTYMCICIWASQWAIKQTSRCIYMYMYVYIYTCMCIHTYTYEYIHVHMYLSILADNSKDIEMYIYIHVCVYIHIRMNTYMCICIWAS